MCSAPWRDRVGGGPSSNSRGGYRGGRGGLGSGRGSSTGGYRGNRGGQGQGHAPRFDDTRDYNSMKYNSVVREFFDRPAVEKPYLDHGEFLSIISLAESLEKTDSKIRHQFLIRLAQSSFLEVTGPIAGSLMRLITGTTGNHASTEEAIKKLLDLLEEMLNRIPHCRNTQPYISTTLGLVEKLRFLDEESKTKLKKLKEELSDPRLLLVRVRDPSQDWSSDLSFIKEPTIPDIDILLNESLNECFVNPTKGGFQSSAHYLETWFRLMREDFLGPLRVAIKQFQETFEPTDRELRRVRLDGGYYYMIEQVVRQDFVDGEFLCLVQFAQEELKRVNWTTTDRLRTDSMIAMSNDHFQTARYATITNHHSRPTRHGKQVWLKMIGGQMDLEWCHGIEPMTYYEPSRCVMERLKVVAAVVDRGTVLPMNRYLVETRKDVQSPAYMLTASQLKLPDGSITDPTNPDISKLGLDSSQEEAMKLALTHEFALIQGPPGTGKSYVGAMFVHLMMINKHLWQTHGRGCIMLLAYKKHAIDQFIGECERMKMDMSNTVRIGASSSVSMDKYLLRNKRNELRFRHEYMDLNFDAGQMHRKLIAVEDNIRFSERVLNLQSRNMDFRAFAWSIPGNIWYQLGYFSQGNVDRTIVFAWMAGNERTTEQVYDSLRTVQYIQYDEAELIYERFPNIYAMPTETRQSLFLYWCESARDEAQRCLINFREWHQNLSEEMQKLRQAQDFAVVRSANILAVTTTGASKHGHLIDAIKPTIVLCEEAAEVLESHIVAPLTAGCKHIVLIGDHKQLRPSISNINMEKRNLSISLFERLISNDLPNRCLQTQHRMHPEIADLLVPHIYDSLQHHTAVRKYPEVDGLSQRMHFFQHNHPEETIGEKSSCMNPFEADYLIGLCHYLLLQGYKPCDITILTTYMGQMRLIKQKIREFKEIHPEPLYIERERIQLLEEEFADYLAMKKSGVDYGDMDNKTRSWFYRRENEFDNNQREMTGTELSKIEDVLVTTVDNYQGEECRIILLSFVRSNPQCNIGFLKWANRICVALSRAKHGFYAIGDFKLFAKNRKSDLWKKLCTQLLSIPEPKISENLEIECIEHDAVRAITDPTQFLEFAPLGGCLEPCSFRLRCGHPCIQLCHPDLSLHDQISCLQPCSGLLSCGHECKRLCNEDGDDKRFFAAIDSQKNRRTFRECVECSKKISCAVEIEVKPPRCGHTSKTLCVDKDTYICQKLIEFSLDCGHSRMKPCSTNKKDIKCRKLVSDTLSCGHEITRNCYTKSPKCGIKLTQTLSCGHEMAISCWERDEPLKCEEEVDVELPCNHTVRLPCHKRDKAENHKCEALVDVELPCNHTTRLSCHEKASAGDPHKYICETLIEVELPCKHKIQLECWKSESATRQKCTASVKKEFSCGHEMEGKCHEMITASARCRYMKTEVLKCGHQLKVECWSFGNTKRDCRQSIEIRQPCGHTTTEECGYWDPYYDGRPTVPEACRKPCLIRCSHDTKCPRKCNKPCRRCLKPCQNQCPHKKCSKRCFEECDRIPCNKPCPKKRSCGHLCGGVCGELCPTACAEAKCRPKGARKGPRKGRRICILPCGHDFTADQLDKHMKVRENDRVQEVIVKSCPMKRCDCFISACPRYANQIRRYQKLNQLANDGTSGWWYCKRGAHFFKCDLVAGVGVASSHRCEAYRELNQVFLDDAADSDDDLPVERAAPDSRPAGLANNNFFRSIDDTRSGIQGKTHEQVDIHNMDSFLRGLNVTDVLPEVGRPPPLELDDDETLHEERKSDDDDD